jgi:hypothetical protein
MLNYYIELASFATHWYLFVIGFSYVRYLRPARETVVLTLFNAPFAGVRQ